MVFALHLPLGDSSAQWLAIFKLSCQLSKVALRVEVVADAVAVSCRDGNYHDRDPTQTGEDAQRGLQRRLASLRAPPTNRLLGRGKPEVYSVLASVLLAPPLPEVRQKEVPLVEVEFGSS